MKLMLESDKKIIDYQLKNYAGLILRNAMEVPNKMLIIFILEIFSSVFRLNHIIKMIKIRIMY